MNENLDLTKILEGCPEGTKFYSTTLGEVSFVGIYLSSIYPIIVKAYNKHSAVTASESFTIDGRYSWFYDGECTLFPSKDQRDWSKFIRFWDKPKVKKFDVYTLQPFDKVLVRDGILSEWTCTLFSHIINNLPFPIYCSGGYFRYCIPYNDNTKHLIGTKEDCPEYYKWWEE